MENMNDYDWESEYYHLKDSFDKLLDDIYVMGQSHKLDLLAYESEIKRLEQELSHPRYTKIRQEIADEEANLDRRFN